MTIEEILKNEGYTDEEAKILIDNPKYAGTLKKLVDTAENGTTALLKAQELEKNIRTFNDETVIPYGAKKDAEAAAARAEAAKYQTYLKSLKEAGYEIPDAYLSAPPAEAPKVTERAPDGRYVKPEDLDSQGRAYMSLMSMSEKARDLLGHGLDIEAEYDDFGKNKRPQERLRDYIDRKYDLSAKQQAKEAKAKEDFEEKLRKEGEERYAKAHPRSENEDLRIPAASKHDKFKVIADEKKNNWQTREGREASTLARQDKYKNLLVQ
jgi:hypothetical protein